MYKFGYVYLTTNLLNGKVYIGKSSGSFKPNYFGSGCFLRQAIRKYGKDSFHVEDIEYADDKSTLDTLEIKYIEDARNCLGKENVYNIAEGGTGGKTTELGSMFGRRHRKESNDKNRLAHIGLKQSLETRQKRRNSMLGKNKGKKYPQIAGKNNPMNRPEVRLKVIAKLTGRKMSAEHCEHMSVRLKGINKNKIWITDNLTNKRVYQQNLQPFLSSGWRVGFTKRKTQ